MANSVTRALRILELLSKAEKPLLLTTISTALGIPKSTAHSILKDLASERFIELHEPASYTAGLKLFEVGSSYLRMAGVVGVVTPELARLTRTLNVTSHYAVLDHRDAVYLCKEDPPGLGIQLASSLGARLPAHLTAVGKTCLSWLPEDQLAEHLAKGSDSTGGLGVEMAEIRRNGYATDDGATALGIQCVAAPVFDLNGMRGAIGVSYLRGAYASMDEVAPEVMDAAARASQTLGGQTLGGRAAR